MKKQFLLVGIFALITTLSVATQAQPNKLSERIQATLTEKTTQATHFMQPDAYGTPLVIKLARQGDTKTLHQIAHSSNAATILGAQDSYGNNLFHVAKNADTVQVIAALIRQAYGTKAPTQITAMVDQKNKLGETPLHAQLNAGHADTFRPLYRHSTLKKKNDAANRQLMRLEGVSEDISNSNRRIYCQEIRQLGSANGRTLLQAAQGQIPYNPQMSALAQNIGRVIPCLANGH